MAIHYRIAECLQVKKEEENKKKTPQRNSIKMRKNVWLICHEVKIHLNLKLKVELTRDLFGTLSNI